MNDVNIKKNRLLCKSLLNEKYKKENAVFIIERWLELSKISSA
jgi:hypothetical protein